MNTTRFIFICFIASLVFLDAYASYKPLFYPYGPQTNVSLDNLLGWKRCWMNVYNSTSDKIEEVFNTCTGAHLLYGCRNSTDAQAFTVMAVGQRSIMMNDTGSENYEDVTVDNGVAFYFNNLTSIGFLRAEDFVSKTTCDMDSTNGEYRLCWHVEYHPDDGDVTSTFKGGYRCGMTQDLNEDAQWIREIWMPADPCEGKNEGDTCDDYNPCTTSTTCHSGVCSGGKPACGCFECDIDTGCTVTPVKNGTSCDDGDSCTEVDTCQSGVCIGSSPVVCTSEQECYTSSCNSTTGLCQASPVIGCHAPEPLQQQNNSPILQSSGSTRISGFEYITHVLLLVGILLLAKCK